MTDGANVQSPDDSPFTVITQSEKCIAFEVVYGTKALQELVRRWGVTSLKGDESFSTGNPYIYKDQTGDPCLILKGFPMKAHFQTEFSPYIPAPAATPADKDMADDDDGTADSQ